MILVVIHISVCVFLVLVILLQRGKGDAGIGFGSSGSQSIFGSRGAGNFLTKTTGVCATIFLVTSFFLTKIRLNETAKSVIKGQESPVASPAAVPSAAVTPAAEPAKENAPAKK